MKKIFKIKYFPGFTLLEIMVALTLSVFVFAILFFSHQIIVNQINSKENQFMDSLLNLKINIEAKFDQSKLIFQEDNQLILITPTDTQSILFNEDNIILNFSQIQNEIYHGNYSIIFELDTSINLINNIQLSFSRDTISYSFSLHKDYTPNIILNHKKINFEY